MPRDRPAASSSGGGVIMDAVLLRAAALLSLFAAETGVGWGVQITGLSVPAEVVNGTERVVLDCEYSLRPGDLLPSAGLVVKWFFNNSPAPVYQWIPGNKPQDLGALKGRLQLDYRASSANGTAHRALCIRRPTTDLTGDYRCAVSTFHDEDFMVKRMVVYAPEKRIEVYQSGGGSGGRRGGGGVNVSCRATGVAPEPKMALYKGQDLKRMVLMESSVESSEGVGGVGGHDVTVTGFLADDELGSPIIVDCELRVPGTAYVRRKLMHYYPGRALPWIAEDSGGSGGGGGSPFSAAASLFLAAFLSSVFTV